MENDPYQLNEVYVKHFRASFWSAKRLFIMKKVFYFNTISTFKKNKTKYQSPIFSCDYTKVYCHITHELEVWNISYVGIGDKYHNCSMFRSSQVL